MAAKHGAHSRLKAQNATTAAFEAAEHLQEAEPQLRVRLAVIGQLRDDAHGGNDVLLGHQAGDGGGGGLPVVEAQRREDPGKQVAQARHQAVVHVVVGSSASSRAEARARIAEVHEEPDDDGGQEDDGTGLDDVALHALPHGQQARTSPWAYGTAGSSMTNGVVSPANSFVFFSMMPETMMAMTPRK